MTRAVVLRPASPALAPFVSSMGYMEAAFGHGRERVLPSGTVQLLVNLERNEMHSWDGPEVQHTPGAALQGPYARPAVVDPAQQRAVVWVGFAVAGAYPFFAAPAAAARDRLVDLDALWGRRGGALLRERLLGDLDRGGPVAMLRGLEAALLARAARPLERDPAIAHAAAALHRGTPVRDVAESLGWTPKRLVRTFTEQVGLTPKRFARVRRLQRLLAAAATAPADPDWARLAAECGYHDQAHLIHDFRALSGMTPTEYAPRSPGARNHVPLLGRGPGGGPGSEPSGTCRLPPAAAGDRLRRGAADTPPRRFSTIPAAPPRTIMDA